MHSRRAVDRDGLAGNAAPGGPENPRTTVETRQDVFGYEPVTSGTDVEWYPNFAHNDLFAFYGGSLLAQDELQVAEHPALGSVREALRDSELKPWTVEENRAAPVLVRGVERRCQVATDANADAGRPDGLYGNQFARAKPEIIEKATRPIVPPTVTNLLAMEAPSYGSGAYRAEQISYILRTAFTAFRAAVLQSAESLAEQGTESAPVVTIHTGFWGCGAYGGNRILMALLQAIAANLAAVNRLVFHTFDRTGTHALDLAVKALHELNAGSSELTVLIDKIAAMNFHWGISDGN
jgi:hypothetical protein